MATGMRAPKVRKHTKEKEFFDLCLRKKKATWLIDF